MIGWRDPQLAPSITGHCVVSGDPIFAVFGTTVAFYIPTGLIIVIYVRIYFEVRGRIRSHLARSEMLQRQSVPLNLFTPLVPRSSSVVNLQQHKELSLRYTDSHNSRTTRRATFANGNIHKSASSPFSLSMTTLMNHSLTSTKIRSNKFRRSRSGSSRRVTVAMALMALASDDSGGSDERRAGSNASDNFDLKKIRKHLKNTQHQQRRRVNVDSETSVTSTRTSLEVQLSRKGSGKFRNSIWKQRERKMAATSLSVTLAFTFCWLPYFLMELLIPLCGCYEFLDNHARIRTSVNWLGYSNSLVNAIIFGLGSDEIRSTIQNFFKC